MSFLLHRLEFSAEAAITSKDMPGCCTYPGLPGYNTHEHRNLKCSKDLRCMVTQFDTPCDLGDAEDLELDAELCRVQKTLTHCALRGRSRSQVAEHHTVEAGTGSLLRLFVRRNSRSGPPVQSIMICLALIPCIWAPRIHTYTNAHM